MFLTTELKNKPKMKQIEVRPGTKSVCNHPTNTPASQRQANPQAKVVPKLTSPSKRDPENHLPKHPPRKSPSPSKKDRTPNKPQTPSTGCHQTPSKPHANPNQSCFPKQKIRNIRKS